MGLIGWICPEEAKQVGLDHFMGECPDPPFPPVWAAMILDGIKGDRFHVGSTLTPTTCLACPRETIIKRFMDYYALPHGADVRFRGSVWHKVMAQAGGKYGFRTEVQLSDIEFPGIGKMSAQVDNWSSDGDYIVDYKITNAGALSFIVKSHEARDDDSAQVGGFYANMLELNFGKRPEFGHIWYTAPLSGRDRQKYGSEWIKKPVRFMGVEELLSYKPGGAGFTVREIVEMLKRGFKEIEEGRPPAEVVKELPLAGLPMLGGQKCQMYCDVNVVCSALGGGQQVLAAHQAGMRAASEYRPFSGASIAS